MHAIIVNNEVKIIIANGADAAHHWVRRNTQPTDRVTVQMIDVDKLTVGYVKDRVMGWHEEA